MKVREMATLGYRYWYLGDEGQLTAPIRNGWEWPDGGQLVIPYCGSSFGKCHRPKCSCGLYAYEANQVEDKSSELYFDLGVGRTHHDKPLHVVGSVWIFHVTRPNEHMIVGTAGIIAALSVPEGASGVEHHRIQQAAARYRVPVCSPEALRRTSLNGEIADLSVKRSLRRRKLSVPYLSQQQ